jgi:hypothetical protein
VTIDATTRVTGRRFRGTFVVARGTRVHVVGRRCRAHPLVVAATRVAIGRP